jgi:hypothetical protein
MRTTQVQAFNSRIVCEDFCKLRRTKWPNTFICSIENLNQKSHALVKLVWPNCADAQSDKRGIIALAQTPCTGQEDSLI